MAKLFSVKLANLENEMNELKQNSVSLVRDSTTSAKVEDLQKQLNELDEKINQMVNELTEILNQHATAIKDLTTVISGKK